MRELTSCFGVICLQRRHLLIGMSEGHQQPQPYQRMNRSPCRDVDDCVDPNGWLFVISGDAHHPGFR